MYYVLKQWKGGTVHEGEFYTFINAFGMSDYTDSREMSKRHTSHYEWDTIKVQEISIFGDDPCQCSLVKLTWQTGHGHGGFSFFIQSITSLPYKEEMAMMGFFSDQSIISLSHKKDIVMMASLSLIYLL